MKRFRKWSTAYNTRRPREPRTRRRRPTSVELLVARLQRLNVIPGSGYRFKFDRTRAGYWQRSAGAWSWFLLCQPERPGEPDAGATFEVGSQLSVVELLKLNDDKFLEWVES